MLKKILFLASLFLAANHVAFAQSPSILRGAVTDQNEAPVPGALVRVASPELQGERTTETDESGRYVLLGLPPGTYAMRVDKTGFKPFVQHGVIMRVGLTLDVDARLGVGDVNEAVTVNGSDSAPIIDSERPELSYNVSGEFLNKLPLSSRQQWEQVWYLIPGAVVTSVTGSGFDPEVHGASNTSNVFKLDGFDISNSFTNQGSRTQFSTESIQDVQIKTAGVEASTPLGQGGFINVVTKSGGKDFHGSAAFFFQPRKWNDRNVPGGTSPIQTLYQPDFSIGGPVFLPRFGEGGRTFINGKDRTWFFASYRRVYTDLGISRSAEALQVFDQSGLPRPDFDRLERSNRFLGKITHQINSSNVISFSYLNDRGRVFNSDASDIGTQEAAIDIIEGGPIYSVSLNSTITSRLLLTARYGYRRTGSQIVLKGGDNPAINRYNSATVSGGNLAGQTLILQYGNRAFGATGSNEVRDHHELTTDLTYVMDNFFGKHTFQTGLQWKPRTRTDSKNFTPSSGLYIVNEVRVVQPNGTVRYVPFRRDYINPTVFPSLKRETNLLGGYVQDRWAPSSRLTLNLGVRVDRQITKDKFGNEQINTVSIDPRLGFALGLNKSGRDVIRASWGRIHDQIYNQSAPDYGSFGQDRTTEWDNNLDGIFETVRFTPGVTTTSSATRFASPDIHANYLDEFQASYTHQFPFKIVFDAAYINRKFKDPLGFFDTNIIYENGRFGGYRNPAFNSILAYTNLTNSYRRYQALEFSAARNVGGRFSGFASYTYQKQVEKGAFAYDNPQGYLNPPEFFEDDKLALPHLIKLSGSFRLPWDITAAALYTLQSGAYSPALVRDLPAGDPQISAFGPATLTLSNGRTVSNPLFTARRLANPRNGERLQQPFLPRLNLRFGKEFRFRERHVLEANLDIFNATNNNTPFGFGFNANNVSSTNYRQASSVVQSPRGAQISVRYRF